MDQYQGQQQEIARLVKENNKMLHAMRRNAFWGGLLKLIIYGVFLLAPVWFYMTYLNDTVQRMMKAVDQIQGTGAKAQAELGNFQEAWKELESKLPSFMRPTSTKQ